MLHDVRYYLFKKAGFETVVASVEGGSIPIDAGSMKGDFFTEKCKQFMHDPDAISALQRSVKIDTIDGSVDALYITGGHGCCTDMHKDANTKKMIEDLFKAGKVVAADCHGPIALAQCKKPDGTPLVAGTDLTSNLQSIKV